ncbi:MAG: Hsp20/alpha crystallin family protein [Dissulfurispiraceae bacterium]|jgi:HSP20 family protein|nr:Hsp20/alpha crystallin family protein [Dissulfurispiraceae bacterium]
MSIVKWGPLRELEDMRRDMDRIFEEFFVPSSRRRHAWPAKAEAGLMVPNVEMYDRENEIVVKAEVPGVSKDGLDLTITKDSLTIKGEVKKEEEVKQENYYFSERSFGTFTRTLALPVEVESEKSKASFENGVLEVVLPKKEEAKAKEIKIEVK